jgi:hypothetical protein
MTARREALYHHGRTIEVQQTQTGVEQMNSDKILVKVPWSKVAILIATLVRSAKGGISKDEAEELLEQLSDIIVHLATGLK